MLAAALCLALGAGAQQRRANVVLIVADGPGYGEWHCTGAEGISTPAIDRLWNEGVRCTNFYADTAGAPTRAALLTGRYSARTGVTAAFGPRAILPENEVAMAQIFYKNGYRTGLFGTWGLGDGWPYHPSMRGFGRTVIHGGAGVGQTPDRWGNDRFDDRYMDSLAWRPFEGYSTDVWFSEAASFIRDHRDEPFFCMIPVAAPGAPFPVPEEYSAPYLQAGVDSLRACYYGQIACIDRQLGELRRTLNGLGLEDNTILIFMTSGGTGIAGAAAGNYPGGQRVPFVIYYRDGGLEGGREVTEPMAHIDLMPTLFEVCGLYHPRTIALDGASQFKTLRGVKPLVGFKPAVRKLEFGSHDDAPAPAEIYVGEPGDSIARLTCNDWYQERPTAVWSQDTVRARAQGDGWWQINVVRTGTYAVTLRPYPKEEDAPLNVSRVRLTIGDQSWEQPCDPDAPEVTLTVPLRAGSYRMQAQPGSPFAYMVFLE
jgi:arylsulfatase A-like enzyme